MSRLGKAVLFFDGKCNFCITIASFLKKIDLLNEFVFIDLWQDSQIKKYKLKQSDLKVKIHLLNYNGKIFKGYSAIKEVLRRIPLLFPFALITYIPWSSYYGERMYEFISAKRYKIIPCGQDC